jgi:iron-sulfur cluster insertion protein
METNPIFTVSDAASVRIAELLAEETEPNAAFRVAVLGGGCSGFQYHFDLDPKRAEDDMVIEKNGARVVIDSTSLELVKGSMLDYSVALVGAAFEIKNPNAVAGCGCGNSFAL